MVESDPDLGEYFLFASHLDSLPVSFLLQDRVTNTFILRDV